MDELKKRILEMPARNMLVVPLLLVGALVVGAAGSPGFAAVWEKFNWLYATRTATGVLAGLLVLGAFWMAGNVEDVARRRSGVLFCLGVAVLFATLFAGLWLERAG